MNKSIKLNAIFNLIKQLTTYLYGFFIVFYISRILGASQYGAYNFGTSVISYFTSIAAFGIGTYAIREGAALRKSKSEFKVFCGEMFSLSLLFTFIAYIGVALILFIPFFNPYRNIILILSMPIIFQCIGVDWAIEAHEEYFYTMIRYIVTHLSSLVLMFIFIKSENDLLLFCLFSTLPNILTNIINIFYLKKKGIKLSLSKLNFKKYFLPLLILWVNTLTISIYVDSDKILLTLMQDDTITGIYSVAVSIYTMAKTTINSLISVSLPRLSSLENNNKEILQKKILHSLLLVLIPCCVGLFFMSKTIINTFLGTSYLDGVNSLRILSITMFFSSFNFYCVYAILLPNKMEKKVFLSTIIGAITNVVLNIILIPLFSLNAAAFTTLISELIITIVCIYFIKKEILLIDKKLLFTLILSILIISITCICFIKLFNYSLMCLLLSVIVSFIIYSLLLYVMKDKIFMNIIKKVSKKQ